MEQQKSLQAASDSLQFQIDVYFHIVYINVCMSTINVKIGKL